MTNPLSYTLGLDVGIASVGWCVLGPDKIIDLGVRCFDKAENEKGESKGLEWRTIKTQRRRLRRKAGRLQKLRKLFASSELLESADVKHVRSPNGESPWQLRAKALDVRLNPEQLARATYHIIKHRGFLSTRKSELADTEKDAGKLYKGVSRTRELMAIGGWRTPGELAVMDPEFEDAKRNKAGDYKNTFDRHVLREELRSIFESQRRFGSCCATEDLERSVIGIFEQQTPALTGSQLLKMVGKCTFETQEYRAPKHSWTAERFVWMTRLNNLRIFENGERRSLSPEERNAIIELPYELSDVKFKTVRTRLKKAVAFSDSARFAGLSYAKDEKDPEGSTLIKLKGWHDLRKALSDAGLNQLWGEISKQPAILDRIALALTLHKTDDDIRRDMEEQELPGELIDALLQVSFAGFIQISLMALYKIVPHMEEGFRFDEACVSAGYNHARVAQQSKQKLLPPISKNQIRNPVVFKSLVQSRKVINALISRFGSPSAVHIELARDLSRPYDERMKIKKAQDAFQQEKHRSRTDFIEKFGCEPNPRNQDLLKYRLYEDQQGKCAYSLNCIDLSRLFESHYVEVDHILPYSRSFDDSQNNKVLVLTSENRNKKNATPFEYFGSDTECDKWRNFQGWVLSNKAFRSAKRERLLRKSFDERAAKEFKERNLTDTRYLARFLKNFIEENLELLNGENKRVLCVNGQFTSFLRTRWGLIKLREQSDKHHAMDAAVIAAASTALVQRVSNFSRTGYTFQREDGRFVSRSTGEVLLPQEAESIENRFPLPWEGFRHELLARLHETPVVELEKLALSSYTRDEIARVRPIFVSRAPKRRNKGAVHKETIRSAKLLDIGISTVRTALTDLKLKSLENIVGYEDPRNKPLIDGLKERLMQFNDDGKKAFAEPFYKPNKLGEATSLVRTVKLKSTQKGGVAVRNGIADQALMIRVDIFSKSKKFFAIPIYQSDRAAKLLPNLAVVANKSRKEWTFIDDSFEFLFSLYPNDLVSLTKGEQLFFGYFAGLDVATGAIHILEHDRDCRKGKEGLHRGLGIKTADAIEKYHVDPLGRRFRVGKEKRHELA